MQTISEPFLIEKFKYVLLVFSIVFLFQSQGLSQHTFETNIKTANEFGYLSDRFQMIEEDTSYLLLFFPFSKERQSRIHVDAYAHRYNKKGELKGAYVIDSDENRNIANFIIVEKGNVYFMLYMSYIESGLQTELVLSKYSKNFVLLEEHVLLRGSNFHFPHFGILSENGDRIISTINWNWLKPDGSVSIIEVNLNDYSLSEEAIPNSTKYFSRFMTKLSADRYAIDLIGPKQRLLITDSSLNLIKTQLIHVESVGDSGYQNGLTYCTEAWGNKSHQYEVKQIDSSGSMKNFTNDSTYIPYGSADTSSYTTLTNFDINQQHQHGYFAFCGQYKFSLSFPLEHKESNFELKKFKLDGNKSWSKNYFSSDSAFQCPIMVKATSDGGALILSTVYNWYDNPKDVNHLHLLKVDSMGNYKKGDPNETPTIQVHEVSEEMHNLEVSPNPAHSFVRIFNPGETTISAAIYSSLGNHIKDVNIHPRESEVDVSNYNSGVAIIQCENGEVYRLMIE